MANSSIYQRQCPQVAAIFTAAKNSDKVLIVPLDFAKDKHVCLLCNGNGDQLLKPFTVKNNRDGLYFLLERIQTTCKRHAINPKHVILGGEDCPSYVINLLWALHQHKEICVVRVNAWKAKKQRENVQASTDKLDLLGVAKTLINRDAYPVFDDDPRISEENVNYEAMRELSRTRDALVEIQTAISNRIHSIVKVLFPGFLDSSKTNPVTPFSNTSLALMERKDFNAGAYARKKPAYLAKLLTRQGVRDPSEKAFQVIERARQVLPPDPQTIPYRQECLSALIASYRHLQTQCRQLEEQEAQVLAATPAAVLTTVAGIGIVTCAAIAGEQGHVERLGSLHNLSSYAGIIPGTDQTGGPDNPGKSTKVKPRCNRKLKKHLVAAVSRMGNSVGTPEFRLEYARLKNNGQHADFVMARRFLRVSKTLMLNKTIYLPPELRSDAFNRESLFEYLRVFWPKLKTKWHGLKAVDAAFASNAPLGIWREMIQKVYRIELPLDRSSEVRLLLDGEDGRLPEFVKKLNR